MIGDRFSEMRWTPERTARFWDWQSQYPELYFTYRFGAEIVRSLREYLIGGKRLLDYGCGVGYLIPHLCRLGGEVSGADPAPESVKRTKERLEGSSSFQGAFLVSDLRKQGGTLDAILTVEIIEHLHDPDLDAMLSDIRAMLAPEGIAVFTTPNDEDREKNMIMCPATGEVFHRWQHVRSWGVESLPARLRAAGFSIVEIKETSLVTPTPRTPYRLLKRIVRRHLSSDSEKPHFGCVAAVAHDTGV
jgi:2-polyprenyl-3-methyl-5-hydroxy-6-metoxy-1,4-benzoquinol methylase